MSETQQSRAKYRGRQEFEEEVELIDYLRVIWKRKYLIVAGTLLCSVGAAVTTLWKPMQKMYRIDVVIQPAIVGVDESGKNVYVDSGENIKAIIEAATFNQEILSNSDESRSKGVAKSIKPEVNVLKHSNALKVSCETSNLELGLRALNRLTELSLKKYTERVAYFQDKYETQIGFKKNDVSDCEAKRRAAERNIKNIQKRIDELKSQIAFVKKDTSSLIQERDNLLKNNKDKGNIVSAILYTNTVQQNLELQNSYRQQLTDYITRRVKEEARADELKGELNRLLEEVKGLESKKQNVRNMEILQSPSSSPYPVKPKMKLNVMLATITGLLVMLFLAFFLEYVQKHRPETEP